MTDRQPATERLFELAEEVHKQAHALPRQPGSSLSPLSLARSTVISAASVLYDALWTLDAIERESEGDDPDPRPYPARWTHLAERSDLRPAAATWPYGGGDEMPGDDLPVDEAGLMPGEGEAPCNCSNPHCQV